jgi:hypothetical protein
MNKVSDKTYLLTLFPSGIGDLSSPTSVEMQEVVVFLEISLRNL